MKTPLLSAAFLALALFTTGAHARTLHPVKDAQVWRTAPSARHADPDIGIILRTAPPHLSNRRAVPPNAYVLPEIVYRNHWGYHPPFFQRDFRPPRYHEYRQKGYREHFRQGHPGPRVWGFGVRPHHPHGFHGRHR